jgi:hypothetical protein
LLAISNLAVTAYPLQSAPKTAEPTDVSQRR